MSTTPPNDSWDPFSDRFDVSAPVVAADTGVVSGASVFESQAEPDGDDEGVPYGDGVTVYPSATIHGQPEDGGGFVMDDAAPIVLDDSEPLIIPRDAAASSTRPVVIMHAADGSKFQRYGELFAPDEPNWSRVSEVLFVSNVPGSHWVAAEQVG